MRVVLQRVSRGRVTIAGERRPIERGSCSLVGFAPPTPKRPVVWMAEKVLGLRIFPDDEGKMNRSLDESAGGVLVVSQFTLYGDARKGVGRASSNAAPPAIAILLRAFCRAAA